MPNLETYKYLRDQGVDADMASHMTSVLNTPEAEGLYAARTSEFMSYRPNTPDSLGAYNGGTSSYDNAVTVTGLENQGIDPWAVAGADPDPANGKGFWDDALTNLFNAIDTIDIPRQAVMQWATGGDLRQAIPDYMYSDAEQEKRIIEGYAHETINFGDFVDDKTGGEWTQWKEVMSEGNWAQRNVARPLGSIAMFGGDVLTDPVTYVAGLGVGKRVTSLMRKFLPASAEAMLAIKVAEKFPKRSTVNNAVVKQKAFLVELAEKYRLNPTDVGKGDLINAGASYKQLRRNLNTYEYYKNLGPESVPTTLANHLKKPGPTATQEEILIHAQRKKALDESFNFIRFEDMDPEMALMRAGMGPDAAEELGEALGRVVAGANHDDILFKHWLNPFAEARTSVDLRMTGIGKDGEIMMAREGMDAMAQTGAEAIGRLDSQLEFLSSVKTQGAKRIKQVVSNVRKVDKLEAKGKVLVSEAADLEKQLIPLDTEIHRLTQEIDHYNTIKTNPGDTKLLKDASKAELAPLVAQRRDIAKQLSSKKKLSEALAKEVEDAMKVSGMTGDITMAVPEFVLREQLQGVDDLITAGKKELTDLMALGGEMDDTARARITELREQLNLQKSQRTLVNRQLNKVERARLKGDDNLTALRESGDAEGVEALETAFAMGHYDASHELTKLSRDSLKDNMAYYTKHGIFPPDFYENANIKLPFGPRRDVLSSAKYLDDKYGTMAGRLFTPLVSPKSTMPSFLPLTMQFAFREPMRVLNDHIPGLWPLINGRMKAQQYEVNGAATKIRRILMDADVLKGAKNESIKGRAIKKFSGIESEVLTKKNGTRDKQLFDLLNHPKNSDEWTAFAVNADEKLLKAHDEVREVLDYYSKKLGLSPEEHIEGYMTHIIDLESMKGGKLPNEYTGSPDGHVKRWFEKARTGDNFTVDSVTDALDMYVRGVSKRLYTDPLMGEIDMAINRWAVGNAGKEAAMKQYGHMLKNAIGGKPSKMGELLNMLPSNLTKTAARRVAATIGGLTYSSALVGNHRYMAMSLLQGINTTSAEFGTLRSLKALAKMETAEGRMYARLAGLDGVHKKMFEDVSEKFLGNMTDLRVALMPSISDTEFFIRGITFHASVDAQLAEMGLKSIDDILDPALMKEVFAEGVSSSENVNHIFGRMAKPVLFTNLSKSGSALATQFFSFPFKQSETLFNLGARDNGFFFDYLVMAGQMSKLGATVGIDVSPYVGITYAKDPLTRDAMSMPVETLTSMFSWIATIPNPDATAMDKLTAQDNMLRGLKNLIPLKAGVRNLTRAWDMKHGVLNDSRGHPILTDVKVNIPAILTGMHTIEEQSEAAIAKAHYKRKSDLRVLNIKLAREVQAGVDNGNIDMEKITKLAQQMKAQGSPLTMKVLTNRLKDSTYLTNVIRRMGWGLDDPVAGYNAASMHYDHTGRFYHTK